MVIHFKVMGLIQDLKQTGEVGEPSNFVQYAPEVLAIPRPQLSGKTAGEKRRLMLGRIKLKQGSEARRVRKLRRKAAAVEAQNLYNEFVCDQEGEEAEPCQVCEAEDKLDEEFWHELAEVKPRPAHIGSHDKKPHEGFQGVVRLSRMQRLTASRSSTNVDNAILGSG